jgi:methylglyoxal synthase
MLSSNRRVPPGGFGLETTMMYQTIPMASRKRVALIAHDHCKGELLEWARYNQGTLAQHELYATGTTGRLLSSELQLPVTCFLSGPLGGDQQVGAAIVEGRIDFVIFFWDPLEPQPHDVDVKALLRIAVVHNVPIACNRATADFLLSSPLMHRDYDRLVASPPRRALGTSVVAAIENGPYQDADVV